jgi:hypothetical protein
MRQAGQVAEPYRAEQGDGMTPLSQQMRALMSWVDSSETSKRQEPHSQPKQPAYQYSRGNGIEQDATYNAFAGLSTNAFALGRESKGMRR